MPRTALTVETTTRAGLTAAYAAADAANGHEFPNAGQNVILHVTNGGGGATVLTFITPGTVDGQAVADRAVSVGSGTSEFIGPFGNSQYGSGTSSNDVYFDIDVDTSVTIATLKLGNP